MRQNISPKQRKALETKMSKVFKEDVKMLSKEMQETLMDDLVTAFVNRLGILARLTSSGHRSDMTIQFSSDNLEFIHSRA